MPKTKETNQTPLTTKAIMERANGKPSPPINGVVNNLPISPNNDANVGPSTNTGINMKSVVNATNKNAVTEVSTINVILRLLNKDKNLLI